MADLPAWVTVFTSIAVATSTLAASWLSDKRKATLERETRETQRRYKIEDDAIQRKILEEREVQDLEDHLTLHIGACLAASTAFELDIAVSELKRFYDEHPRLLRLAENRRFFFAWLAGALAGKRQPEETESQFIQRFKASIPLRKVTGDSET
jgi:hypothetical protein